MDARAALRVLEGSGFTLEQAALAVVGRGGSVVSTEVSVGVDAFLRRCVRKNLSPKTLEFYEDKLWAFEGAFSGRKLDSLTRPELRVWLDELPVVEPTRMGYVRAVSVCLNWCIKQDPPMLLDNPAKGLGNDGPKAARAIDILTPGEARAVMAAAGVYAPMLALMLFAGTRPSEIHSSHKPPMLWGQIDPVERIIRISAEQSKTRNARPMEELPKNLWAWLEKRGPDDAPVAPGRSRQAIGLAKKAIGRWSPDVCRHSFFTYHLAAFGDISKTMIIAGHEASPAMMYQHYRGVATKAQAVEFFGITPGAGGTGG